MGRSVFSPCTLANLAFTLTVKAASSDTVSIVILLLSIVDCYRFRVLDSKILIASVPALCTLASVRTWVLLLQLGVRIQRSRNQPDITTELPSAELPADRGGSEGMACVWSFE